MVLTLSLYSQGAMTPHRWEGRIQDLAAVDSRWSELLITLLNFDAIAGS